MEKTYLELVVDGLTKRMDALEKQIEAVRKCQETTNKVLWRASGIIIGLLVAFNAGATEYLFHVFSF